MTCLQCKSAYINKDTRRRNRASSLLLMIRVDNLEISITCERYVNETTTASCLLFSELPGLAATIETVLSSAQGRSSRGYIF